MEMHLVHFNTKYGHSIGEAMLNSNNAWDTLAVLGVMFQVDEEDNHHFDNIVEGKAVHVISQVLIVGHEHLISSNQMIVDTARSPEHSTEKVLTQVGSGRTGKH
jgi:Eukaryotic-type carbonic anhydrase